EARAASRGGNGADGGARKGTRQDQPVPSPGRDAERRAAAPGGARRLRRPLSAGAARLLGRQGRLRTRNWRGRDPMRTLSFVHHAALVALAAATAAGCTRAAAREAIPPQPVKAAEVT